MSTQQDIYAAGSESRPSMLNKENYVPWSSRLLHYAKSRPNGKLIHNSIINGPYVRRMIPEPGDKNWEIEADDQAIQTIILVLLEDIYAAEKKAKLFNEWERFTSNKGESIESYYHRFLKLMNDLKRNKHFPEKIASNLKFLNNLQLEWSRHIQDPLALMANSNNPYAFPAPHQDQPSFNQNYMQQPMPNPEDITDPATAMNMALVLMAKAFKLNYSTPTNNNQRISLNPRNKQIVQPGMNMGQDRQMQMVGGNGGNQFRQYAWQNAGNLTGYNDNQIGNGNLVAARTEGNAVGQNGNQIRCYNYRGVGHFARNCTHASTVGTQTDKALVYDLDGSIEETVEQHPANFEETRALYDSLYQNLAIEVEKVNSINRKLKETNADLTTEEAAKFVEDFKSLAKEADDSLVKHKALELEIERVLKAVVSQDIINIVQKESVVDTLDLQTELEHTLNLVSQKLDNANVELKFQVLNYARENAHRKATYKNLLDSISVTQLFKKASDQNDNTSDTSVKTKFAKQSIMENLPKVGEIHALSNPVISNSISTPQESKVVKNDKVIAPGMFRINPFKTSREEKHVPNNVRASARTKPITVSQPSVIPKKDVNFDSNGVEVEEHHRNLLLFKNNKHMSSACNNIKLDSQNVISKVVCAMCKKCLISVIHDVCLRNYVNGKNSRGKKHKANVSIKEKQKKHQPRVKKPKKVGFIERLATPKLRKLRFLLRWSPTGRLFDQKGKIVNSSESESQSDCSNSDNACCSKLMTGNLNLLINFVWKFMGTVRFENDHVAAILGFGDLQWGNILINRAYFVEGLGHNLFSLGLFCDLDLEVAFRRNACFVRNLEGVDLLKGDRSTNLYTINLHEMDSASPICLMARASSTKSWLWHQRLSHLNFDTINDLARNDLVSGLPKFNYHKEHLCPSCEQGKNEKESHPPKPVPNSRQRLHLFHMDLCGPMIIASINGKRYVLVIVDDYSRYTWVHFLRSKDEAPEVIKTFLKRISVLLLSPVIVIRTDNGT
nr:retrovirus-related Pol polyprotein from transposon TNT 1-94 [Tanacetum cinerariifolium]